MQRRAVQSIVGVLIVSIALSAFAQDSGAPALPPVLLPAAAAPTITAPEVTVVATPTPAPAAATPSLPADAPPAGTPEAARIYSYGNSSLSILFLPTQVDRMKQAIRNYESNQTHAPTNFVAAEPIVASTGPVATIVEPPSYPVFYLASIAYHTPGDWSLWVSGHKITSRKNDTDLSVISVSRDSASFSWTPTYIAAINQRNLQKAFAKTDPVKNRLLAKQSINLNEKNNAVTFTLRTNQSFAAGYFSLFEGYVPAPAMPAVASASPSNVEDEVSLGGAPTTEPQDASVPSTADVAPSLSGRTVMRGLLDKQAP